MTATIDNLPPRWHDRIRIGAIPPGLNTPCWIWTGSQNGKGYGKVSYFGQRHRTHRFSYELLVGPIPAGLQIDHLCRVRSCMNPQHLEPVTPKINQERSARATKTHCAHGHPFSGENLRVTYRNGWTERKCRECKRRYRKQYKLRKRLAKRQAVSV